MHFDFVFPNFEIAVSILDRTPLEFSVGQYWFPYTSESGSIFEDTCHIHLILSHVLNGAAEINNPAESIFDTVFLSCEHWSPFLVELSSFQYIFGTFLILILVPLRSGTGFV